MIRDCRVGNHHGGVYALTAPEHNLSKIYSCPHIKSRLKIMDACVCRAVVIANGQPRDGWVLAMSLVRSLNKGGRTGLRLGLILIRTERTKSSVLFTQCLDEAHKIQGKTLMLPESGS